MSSFETNIGTLGERYTDHEQQLRKELGNLIESAQEGWITKTDLDAAIEGVKDDQKDDIKKRTDYIISKIDVYFKTVTASYNKRYEDFVKTIKRNYYLMWRKKLRMKFEERPMPQSANWGRR